jgi:hypothetical protein
VRWHNDKTGCVDSRFWSLVARKWSFIASGTKQVFLYSILPTTKNVLNSAAERYRSRRKMLTDSDNSVFFHVYYKKEGVPYFADAPKRKLLGRSIGMKVSTIIFYFV